LSDYVKIEKGLGPEGRIAVVRFDRGDGINALSPEALRQLTAARAVLRMTPQPLSWC
jgi:enoyl-CoA hydratase